MDSSITWLELVINCLLLLDFLRSGSSSEPQNTGQPGEEEQEEMRDTLDPPEDAWEALNAWEDTLEHLLNSRWPKEFEWHLYRAATVWHYRKVTLRFSRVVSDWYVCYISPSSSCWLETEDPIRFPKADCCNWANKHNSVENKHVSPECDIKCWWNELHCYSEWTSVT